MKAIEISGHKVEIYNSIDELPIKRFHKFNKYMLIDAGVGSDLNDLNTKIAKILRYIDTDDKTNAKIELENIRQQVYLLAQEVNVKHLAFMPLIKSVDGVEITDLSDDNLKKLQAYFDKEPVSFFKMLFDSFKKKVDTELNLYFPGRFNDSATKEYHDRLRARALLQLDEIIRKKEHGKDIEDIDNFLLTLAKPKIFSGKESIEIAFDKQFEDMCLLLSKELSLNIDNLTVLQFYNSFDFLKKQQKGNGR